MLTEIFVVVLPVLRAIAEVCAELIGEFITGVEGADVIAGDDEIFPYVLRNIKEDVSGG